MCPCRVQAMRLLVEHLHVPLAQAHASWPGVYTKSGKGSCPGFRRPAPACQPPHSGGAAPHLPGVTHSFWRPSWAVKGCSQPLACYNHAGRAQLAMGCCRGVGPAAEGGRGARYRPASQQLRAQEKRAAAAADASARAPASPALGCCGWRAVQLRGGCGANAVAAVSAATGQQAHSGRRPHLISLRLLHSGGLKSHQHY